MVSPATTADYGDSAPRTAAFRASHTPKQPRASPNRTAITYPDGITVTTDHDALNRPYFLSSSLGCCLLHMAYHPNGAPLASSRPDGSWSWLTYDPLQRPASLAHHFPGGASDVLWSYGRNPAGQLASRARDNGAYAWTGHYAVDGRGRRHLNRFAGA